MNKPTFDLSKYRAILSTWNLIGTKLFMVKKEPADLTWNDRVRENDKTRPIEPIMKYMIEGIEVYHAGVVVGPDGVTPLIELNNDPSLQFKVTPAKFREVNAETVTEALASTGELGKEPILFTDFLKLTEQVNRFNAIEIQKAEEEAERYCSQAKLLKDLNKLHKSECDKYYDELGQ